MTDIKEIVASVNKQFGEATLGFANDLKYASVERINTGSLFLDYVLGRNIKTGAVGWPIGRIVELYGPESSGKSLISMKTIVEAQKKGMTCVYIDCENAFDMDFAEKLGVDVSKLLISREDKAGHVFDMICKILQDDGDVKVVVFDSLASMIPEVEIEASLEDQQMALMARIMSKGLRKLISFNKNRALFLFINQLRMNPGAGCFQYNTRVVLENGKTKRIGTIVNQRIRCNVLSYNEQVNMIEFTPITNWFRNGITKEFVHFIFQKPQGRGRGEFSCTSTHKLMISHGIYKEAKDVKIGDEILTVIKDFYPSKIQREIIIGGLLGDGCLSKTGKQKYQYRETHCKKQNDYLKWKASYFNKKTLSKHIKGGLLFSSYSSTFFENQYNNYYRNNKKHTVPLDIKLTPLILAIWYQDDGYLDKKSIVISTNCFDAFAIDTLQRQLKEEFNIITGRKLRRRKEIELTFNRENTVRFFEVCKQFIHPSMRYKCPYPYNKVNFFNPPPKEFEIKRLILKSCFIISKYIKPKTRSMVKFDLETKNHNYIVDGAIVHNSYTNPEYTPGGNALKYYSSIRVDVRRGDWIIDEKDKKVKLGQVVKFRVVKNKTDVPHKEGYFKFLYTGELDRIDELVSLGLLKEVISRKGAYYNLVGKTFLGREEMEKALKTDTELFEKARKEIFEVKKYEKQNYD